MGVVERKLRRPERSRLLWVTRDDTSPHPYLVESARRAGEAVRELHWAVPLDGERSFGRFVEVGGRNGRAYTARQVGLEAPLAEASDRVNERTKQELVEQVSEMARPGDKVAVLGVTYRPNTYITEEAAGLYLAQQLKRRGYRVFIHDFAATPANSPSLHEFERISNWEEFKANPGVGLAVICCPWPQYRYLAATAGTRVFTPWLL